MVCVSAIFPSSKHKLVRLCSPAEDKSHVGSVCVSVWAAAEVCVCVCVCVCV